MKTVASEFVSLVHHTMYFFFPLLLLSSTAFLSLSHDDELI